VLSDWSGCDINKQPLKLPWLRLLGYTPRYAFRANAQHFFDENPVIGVTDKNMKTVVLDGRARSSYQ
jgi:hypothetical protein